MPTKPKLQRKQPKMRAKVTLEGGVRLPMRVSGFVVFPSAVRQAKNYVSRAQNAGLVNSPSEFAVSMRAMVAAGISKAQENNIGFVTAKHVKQGWSEKLSVGGGNCPPHRCMARSILKRVDDLRQSLPFFDELLKQI